MILPFGAYQGTLSTAVSFKGIGVHSGKPVSMQVFPAPPGHGIQFVRTDCSAVVSVSPKNLKSKGYCTVFEENGVSIYTTEHFLAACLGLGIDNVLVKIDAPELPIFDGSSSAYLLKMSGFVVSQSAKKDYYLVRRPIKVEKNGAFCEIEPSNQLKVNFTISYDHPFFAQNRLNRYMIIDKEVFINELAWARTYGFIAQLPQLKQMGLAQGASMQNTVVLDEQGVINPEGLRHEKELVSHKILDLLGDLYGLGCPIIGKINAYCSGHALNSMLIDELIQQDALVKISKANLEAGNKHEAAYSFCE